MIEICSNEEKTEFAIRLSGDSVFKAATNKKETNYENIVATSPYLADYEYNWVFALRHWLINNGYSELAERL